eukprot:11741780-Alexandrium_andersonii.AAC.1
MRGQEPNFSGRNNCTLAAPSGEGSWLAPSPDRRGRCPNRPKRPKCPLRDSESSNVEEPQAL